MSDAGGALVVSGRPADLWDAGGVCEAGTPVFQVLGQKSQLDLPVIALLQEHISLTGPGRI